MSDFDSGGFWDGVSTGESVDDAQGDGRETRRPSFLATLSLVNTVIDRVCNRKAVVGDEREEFSQWALTRLYERRQAIWGQFRHDSQFSTYLESVVENLLKDHRIEKWGRWRPSALAQRLGALAVELERLIYRDRLSAHDAIEVLASGQRPGSPARETLWELVAQLPFRAERRPSMDSSLLEEVVADDRACACFGDAEHAASGEHLARALGVALAGLSEAQRTLLEERYVDERKVVDIASERGSRPSPLYAQLGRALRSLRRSMEAQGVECDMVVDYLDRRDMTFDLDRAFSEPPGSAI